MFWNELLRRMSELKRQKQDAEGKLHDEELHNLYSSLNINTVTNSRGVTWVGHVAHVEV
jgi:hypothetical protein